MRTRGSSAWWRWKRCTACGSRGHSGDRKESSNDSDDVDKHCYALVHEAYTQCVRQDGQDDHTTPEGRGRCQGKQTSHGQKVAIVKNQAINKKENKVQKYYEKGERKVQM